MSIAFDAFSDSGLGTSIQFIEWDHTVSGSDRALVVGLFADIGTDHIFSVRWNGNLMTQIDKEIATADRYTYLYLMVAPDTGTHKIRIDGDGAMMAIQGMGVSYTGVQQTSQPDSFAKANSASATSIAPSVTVVATSWLVMVARTQADPSAGTGATERGSSANGIGMYDSNGTVAAGTRSIQATGPSNPWSGITLALNPSVAGGSNIAAIQHHRRQQGMA